MVNTRLESAIQGMHEDTLEQLAADLLNREGYDVEPTSTSGPDNGRDAFVKKEGKKEPGVVHCSIRKGNIEKKINDDASTAADHEQNYAFFIFFTSQDMATIMRDRLEKEISDKHGFRTRIWDFEHIRNSLISNTENHDLARHHLSVDPAGILNEVKSQLDRIEDRKDLRCLQSQPRISVDSWQVSASDEPVPLMAAETLEKTQTQLLFRLSNIGKGNAYNLRSCLYAKPVGSLFSPPVEEIRKELLAADPTSKLRRDGREPERDPKNHLEDSESADFLSNTFVYINGEKRNAFAVDATGPPAPGTTMPDGFAVGIKLIYNDEFGDSHEKIILAAIGETPNKSILDFFQKIKGVIKFDRFESIYPEQFNIR